jgi:hypothetical protein
MRLKYGLAFILGAAPLFLLSARAFSDNVPVNITNDGTEAILVTVYDVSVQPRAVVVSSQRVNGFSTIPVNVPSDSRGRANIAWTAVTVDPENRKCGHAVRQNLADSSAVTVHANDECAARPPEPRATSYEE